MEYPPNSKKVTNTGDEKKVERVTSAQATRRKKPLGKQFSKTFIGGDAKTAMHYVVFDVLIPAAKDALADAGSQGLERLIFGESRSKRGRGATPMSGATGYVSYNRMGMGGNERPALPKQLSRRARSQHDFDEIVLPSRTEAEEVLDRLFDLVSRYDSATVADLYELTGLEGTHTDNKWGWTNLRGASVTRVRGNGYLLDLPDPEPLG